MKSVVHVLCGLPGSGKSTFAGRLLAETKAIRLANDDWMIRLFGTNPPEKEFRVVVRKIEQLQWELAVQLLVRGVDVIWDYGVWSKQDRAELAARCAAAGAEFKLYYLPCDFETAVNRVLARYAAQPESSLWINREAMQMFRSKFEEPSEDEGHPVQIIEGGDAARAKHG